MTESHHRRTYLVDRSFQLKYILLLMGWGVVLAGLFGLWTWQAQQQALETLVRDPAQRALVARADRQLAWALGAIAVLSAAALGLLGFIMTHRVAGPVYVMGHFLTQLAEGRYPTRRALRKHDELQAFHAHFLDAIEAMKTRDLRQLAQLEEALGRMKVAAARAPEIAAGVAVLEAEIRERRERLAEGLAAAATPIPGHPELS